LVSVADCAGGSTASWKVLVSTARQLLDAALFSKEHMTHLQALALASVAPVSHRSQDDGQAPVADAQDTENNAKAASKAPRQLKYAALLPEVRMPSYHLQVMTLRRRSPQVLMPERLQES